MISALLTNAYGELNFHKYNVYVSGIKAREKEFYTRRDAEIYMQNICAKYGIDYKDLTCKEYSKHERTYVYDNDHNVKFQINRI